MEKRCLIIAAGSFTGPPEQLPCYDFVIACDKGWKYADSLGIKPDLIIGDFDSADAPVNAEVPIKRFPSVKDDTDTMLAFKYAINHGFRDIYVLYALGGRLDHEYANIQSLHYAAVQGCSAVLAGLNDVLTAFSDADRCFPRRKGWSFSIFSMSDRCTGVSITGTKYEVESVELTNSFPLGVSNAWEKDEAVVSVEKGTVLVIESRLQPGEHN